MNDSECFEAMKPLASPERQTNLPFFVVILLTILAVVIILLTVFGNLLVLCFKARVGRTNTTLLVWNLGLTDFLVGLIVLPLGAIHLLNQKWMFGRLLCRFWVATDVTFCTCSVVTICIISVDRYFAVTQPLRYKSIVTKCKVIIVMATIWTFSTAILLTTVRWDLNECIDESICFAGNEIRFLAHSVVFAFFLPASVTLTLYWRIYKLARNRQKALNRGFLMILGQNMNFLTNTIAQNTALRVHVGRNEGIMEHQRRVLRTHERIAKTLGVVSCSFLFCWLPFFSLYLTNYQCDGCIPTIAIDIASWLGYCNSMLNPIIYSFTVREYKRSAIRAILPIWKFLHRIFPFCIKKPPQNVAAKVSRTGRKAKTRLRHEEIKKKLSVPAMRNLGVSNLHVPRSSIRRCTEPAIVVNKTLKEKEEEMDPEALEDEEIEDFVPLTIEIIKEHEKRSKNDSERFSEKTRSIENFREKLSIEENNSAASQKVMKTREHLSHIILPTNGINNTFGKIHKSSTANGQLIHENEGSSISSISECVKVYCVTKEVTV